MMIRNVGRSTTGILVGLLLLTTPLAAGAQEKGKVYRVGELLPLRRSSTAEPLQRVLSEGLRRLGWIEGENITIERRYSEGTLERLPALVGELVGRDVDIIVALGTPAALAAQRATSRRPIVFAFVADPVGVGLVDSLARPGGNLTGLATMNSELTGKWLELLKEVVPSAVRVAVLWDSADPSYALAQKVLPNQAGALGMALVPFGVRHPDELDAAFGAMVDGRIDAVVVGAGLLVAQQKRVVGLAARYRIPAIYAVPGFVKDAGGLMAYATNSIEHYQRVAVYIDRILKGAKPADLPVEQPTDFDLWINLTTAKALNLTIPRSVLMRADQLIE